MASFTVEEIKKATDGNILQTGSMDYCTGVSTDTRTIEPESLFIALKDKTIHFDDREEARAALRR